MLQEIRDANLEFELKDWDEDIKSGLITRQDVNEYKQYKFQKRILELKHEFQTSLRDHLEYGGRSLASQIVNAEALELRTQRIDQWISQMFRGAFPEWPDHFFYIYFCS